MPVKRFVVAGCAVALVTLISACDDGPTSADPTTTSTAEESTSATLWEPPSDGTWPGPDTPRVGVGYGLETTVRSNVGPAYRLLVVAPPQFGPVEDGRVTVRQEMSVTRLAGAWGSPSEMIDLRYYAGVDHGTEGFNLSYDEGTVLCEGRLEGEGDAATCWLSAEGVKRTSVRNSYWMLNTTYVAAWPGQGARD